MTYKAALTHKVDSTKTLVISFESDNDSQAYTNFHRTFDVDMWNDYFSEKIDSIFDLWVSIEKK